MGTNSDIWRLYYSIDGHDPEICRLLVPTHTRGNRAGISKQAKGFQERAKCADNGNTDGNRKHAEREGSLIFVSMIEFVPQTID